MPMRRSELLEERQLRCGESAQAGEFDDRLDAVFKQHRQHDHVLGHCLEKTGANRRGLLGQVGDEHAALFRGALADQSLADTDLAQVAFRRIGVGGEQAPGCLPAAWLRYSIW